MTSDKPMQDAVDRLAHGLKVVVAQLAQICPLAALTAVEEARLDLEVAIRGSKQQETLDAHRQMIDAGTPSEQVAVLIPLLQRVIFQALHEQSIELARYGASHQVVFAASAGACAHVAAVIASNRETPAAAIAMVQALSADMASLVQVGQLHRQEPATSVRH